MKSKVRFGAAMVVAAALVIGCSSSGQASPTASQTGVAASQSVAASQGAVATTGAPFKVGVEAVYSGALASVGGAWTNGFEMYLQSVGNTAGGRLIQEVKEDELGTTQGALAKAKKLVEQDNVDILAGITSSADALVVRDYITTKATTPLIVGVGSTNALLTGGKASPYVFRSSVNTNSEAGPLGAWAYANVGKTAVIATGDTTQGHDFASVFASGFTAAGGKIVAQIFSPSGTNDYQPYLTQIAAAAPAMVFSSYTGTDALAFVKQFAQFGLNKTVKIVSVGSLVSADILPQEGAAAAGIYTIDMWTAGLDNPENAKFLADYKTKYKTDAPVYAVYGFDAARMIVEALNATKGDTSNIKSFTDALANVQFASPRGAFKLAPNHDPIQNFYVMQVDNSSGTPALKVIATIKDVVPPQS
jgi:branched-chain amino acid transport system substrate-binding protein